VPAIEIVEYRPAWAEEFAVIGSRLRAALGGRALRVDHIGSTSVPGLAAKDVIDVQVSVASLDLDLDEEVRLAFEHLGLSLNAGVASDHVPSGARGAMEDWAKRMASEQPGGRRTHVHFRVSGKPNERYPLLFRDYLRASRSAADSYGTIKRALAARHADDVDAYYAVKDPVCDLIVHAAELFAAATGWRLPPSDC